MKTQLVDLFQLKLNPLPESSLTVGENNCNPSNKILNIIYLIL